MRVPPWITTAQATDMTSVTVTTTDAGNSLAAFRLVIWMETLALSVMLWAALVLVVAKVAGL